MNKNSKFETRNTKKNKVQRRSNTQSQIRNKLEVQRLKASSPSYLTFCLYLRLLCLFLISTFGFRVSRDSTYSILHVVPSGRSSSETPRSASRLRISSASAKFFCVRACFL